MKHYFHSTVHKYLIDKNIPLNMQTSSVRLKRKIYFIPHDRTRDTFIHLS